MESTFILELSEEHRCIERLLASLLRVTAKATVGDDRTKLLLAQHLELFRTLLDAIHHGREEEVLFEALHAAGLPLQAGPVGVMLTEHELGRKHLLVLARIALSSGPLQEQELAEMTEYVTRFAQLLSSHIAKEDSVLYPMTLARLSAEGLVKLDTAAAAWRGHSLGERIRLMVLADKLGERTLSGRSVAAA